MRKEVKNKLLNYYDSLQLEEAHALNREDKVAFEIAFAKIQTVKDTLNFCGIEIDGINK